MRRLIVLPAALLVLASCATKSDIPAEEVLRLSTQANRAVRSAAIDLSLSLNIPSAAGVSTVDAEIAGIMQNAGTQLQFDLDAEGTSAAGTRWSTRSSFVVAGEGEVYAKIGELTADPPLTLLPPETIADLRGRWWLLPSASAGLPAGDVTPDPRMLRMQTEVIDVTRDRGIVTLDGQRVHHYDTALNNDKLAAFLAETAGSGSTFDASALNGLSVTGELWIDAGTYVLRRARWNARGPNGEPVMKMEATISDHDNGFTVSPPADAQPLPTDSFLPALPVPTP